MDKVLLYDDERLDKPDTLALQNYPYEYLERAITGLMGAFSGVLTEDPSHSINVTEKSLTIPAPGTESNVLLFQSFKDDSAGAVKKRLGRVVKLDTSNTLQPVLTAVWETDEVSMLLWAKRGWVNGPEEDRKVWDPATGTEKIEPKVTKQVEIIESLAWQKSGDPHPGGASGNPGFDQWFVIGTMAKALWQGATAVSAFRFQSAFDRLPTFTELDTALSGGGITVGDEAFLTNSEPDVESRHGLFGQLRHLRSQVQFLIDGTGAGTWLDTATDSSGSAAGIMQILEKISAINDQISKLDVILGAKNNIIAKLEARIAILEATQVVAWGYFKHVDDSYKLISGTGFKALTTSPLVAGKYILTLADNIKGQAAIVCAADTPTTSSGGPSVWIDDIVWLSLEAGHYHFTTFAVNNVTIHDTNVNGLAAVKPETNANFVIVTGFKPTS